MCTGLRQAALRRNAMQACRVLHITPETAGSSASSASQLSPSEGLLPPAGLLSQPCSCRQVGSKSSRPLAQCPCNILPCLHHSGLAWLCSDSLPAEAPHLAPPEPGLQCPKDRHAAKCPLAVVWVVGSQPPHWHSQPPRHEIHSGLGLRWTDQP